MMPGLDILSYLDAGGNLALFALVWIMWKFDRRLVRLETIMNGLLRREVHRENSE